MTLQELLDSVDVVKTSGDLRSEVVSITEDSRAVKPGSVFVAIQGLQHDGHHFVNQAFAQGATAVVVEEGCFQGVPAENTSAASAFIHVNNSRKALGFMASQLGLPAPKPVRARPCRTGTWE